jgi:primosomal protein N' (replication factor Y)
MPHSYADIVIPKPVHQTFQYRIPADLLNQVAVGKRVKVPFGRQVIHGYVVGLSSKAEVEKIKLIIEVLDDHPVINPDLMALSEWISSYYFSPPGITLKMIVPPNLAEPKTKRSYLLNIPLSQIEAEMAGLKRSPRQAEILQLFLTHQTDKWDISWGDSSACKALVSKNLLLAVEEEVLRNPYSKEVQGAAAPILNDEQSFALQKIKPAIEKGEFYPFLLYGITGSGKTEVYLKALEHNLSLGKEGILVVPEISLTPQMIDRVQGRFAGKVAVIHSGLSAGERADAWRRIQNGEVSIVVGVRSSIFAPFRRLGLIIIDEEHDGAYKQENDVKYHARDTALVRAKKAGAVVLLGSATPALETYYNSQIGKSERILLTRRVEGRGLPAVTLVNLKETEMALKGGGISRPLHEAILKRLERKEQTLLFLNRRGFSPFLLCYDCGFSLKCRHCSVSLTFHKKTGSFHCHYCDFSAVPLVACPQCHGSNLAYLGQGTEKIEEELIALYPGARIARMDRDSMAKKFAHDHILGEMRDHKIDILVGTQMVTKGHDLPSITLVGVLCADTILNLPDFRSAEKTFQTLTQVAGRAGRGDTPGEVFVQTFNPDHYSIVYAKDQDYHGFCEKELLFRKELNYPPFTRMISFLLSGKNEKQVEEKTHQFAGLLARYKSSSIEMLGPAQAPLYKLNGNFRWRCLIKGKEIRKVQEISREIIREWAPLKKSGIRLEIDVDPQNMM